MESLKDKNFHSNGPYRLPEHKFTGKFCECNAPLYIRGDIIFCKNCNNPKAKSKFQIYKQDYL